MVLARANDWGVSPARLCKEFKGLHGVLRRGAFGHVRYSSTDRRRVSAKDESGCRNGTTSCPEPIDRESPVSH